MKTKKLKMFILFALSVVSCEKSETISEQAFLKNENVAQRQSNIFDYVQSISIGYNETHCENNVLIFPTWEKVWETADKLDIMIEEQCDAFDITVPANTSEEQYDILADEAGFDEDTPLIEFENDLKFCSLRRKIEELENAWLNLQGDGEWNVEEDPDSHFIEDETERSLFSERNEIIIGDKRLGFVYYKLFDDFNWIEVHNNDFEAIAAVSSGQIPVNNPNVIVQNIKKQENSSDCRKYVKSTNFYADGSNRIKRKSKIINEDWWSQKKISAVTVGYKKKNGKWKRRRTWITVGIKDVTGNNASTVFHDCEKPFEVNKLKTKCRRKVKVKERGVTYNSVSLIMSVKPQMTYGIHKQGVIDLKLDYHEM